MNIVSYLKDGLSAEVVESIASYINEDATKTKVATDVLVTAVVAALLKRSSSESGAHALYKSIEREKLNGSLVEQLPGIMKNRDQIAQMIQKGSNVFSHLLPDKRSVLIAMVTSQAKIRNSSTTSILGILSYLTLDILGKQAKEQNLDSVGLAMVLRNQKEILRKESDPEILDKVVTTLSIEDLERIGYFTPVEEEEAEILARTRARNNTENRYADLTETAPFPWKGVVTIGAVLAFLAAGYFGWKKFGDQIQATADTTQGEVALPADSMALAPRVDKPAPVTNTVLADQITQHLNTPGSTAGKILVFEGIKFDTLTNQPATESVAAIDGLVGVLKKYPALQLKFTGVTKSLGDKKMMFKRANNLKMYISNAGIDLMRLDAASFLSSDTTRPNTNYVVVKVVRQ